MRGVIARATASGATFSVRGSTSANTGRAPVRAMASAVKAAVSGRRDDLVARARRPSASQRELDRLGAVGDADRVRRADSAAASSRSNASPSGPEDEPAGVEHARDRLVDLARAGRRRAPSCRRRGRAAGSQVVLPVRAVVLDRAREAVAQRRSWAPSPACRGSSWCPRGSRRCRCASARAGTAPAGTIRVPATSIISFASSSSADRRRRRRG